MKLWLPAVAASFAALGCHGVAAPLDTTPGPPAAATGTTGHTGSVQPMPSGDTAASPHTAAPEPTGHTGGHTGDVPDPTGHTGTLPHDTAQPTGGFVDITVAAGLSRRQLIPGPTVPNDCFDVAGTSGGAAVGDVDGDGLEDLFVTRWYLPNLLYLNRGDGTFAEVGAAAGVDATTSATGALLADLDGDGDLDLAVATSRLEPFHLYVNDGTGSFADEAAARGFSAPLPLEPFETCTRAHSLSAGDPDRDGDLDLLVAQWVPSVYIGNGGAHLLVNDGAGSFTRAPQTLGPDTAAAYTAAFADVDDDAWPDVLVAADWGRSVLMRNLGGTGFADVTASTGVGTDENGMGQDIADFDGDGDLDWFVTAIRMNDPVMCATPTIGCSGNRLYRNGGAGVFSDATGDAGVRDAGWAWGARFVDLDHDGDLDLVVANGAVTQSLWPGSPDLLAVWENTGPTTPMVRVDGALGIVDPVLGRAVVTLDLEGDGDRDLFVTRSHEPPTLYRNDVATGAWLYVALDGSAPNTRGVGARVEVQAAQGGPLLRRDVHANSTFLATESAGAHFGLGTLAGPIHEVRVTWPRTGAVTTLSQVAPNQRLVVAE